MENQWAIKAVLRGFELALGLGVKFHNSNLIVINVDPSFLVLEEDILYSSIEFLHFKYLGMAVGAKPQL